jgi:glycosyltransferase involved in cell wall biosynthesis
LAANQSDPHPAVVALIGSLFPIPPQAGTPRPFQLLKRLAKFTPVHLLAVVPQDAEAWASFEADPALAGVFASTHVRRRGQQNSLFGQAATWLSGRPLFDLQYLDASAKTWAHDQARALAREHGPVVFYAWGQDSLQYLPRAFWRACVFDLVDAPCLALERRIAGDRALGRLERWKLRAALLNLRRFEREVLHSTGVVSLNSSADIATLRATHPHAPILNVIDGGDAEYFSAEHVRGVAEAPAELVFFGNMAFPPNADAAIHLARDILPLVWRGRPEATATLIGPSPPDALRRLHDGRRIHVTGFVDDVRPYLARATVVVSPLRFGAGMKNKLQAGLAMGKAMVASPITCEGFDLLEPGVHALVTDGAEATARATLELLGDPERRRALGAAGRALIVEHYSWDTAGAVLWANLRHLPACTG